MTSYEAIYGAIEDLTKSNRPSGPVLLERIPLEALHDLRRQTLCHTPSFSRLWDAWLARAGVSGLELEAGLTLDHFDLTPQAAPDSAAMGRRPLIADDLAHGRLVATFPGPFLSACSYCTYLRENRQMEEAAILFLVWLEQERNLASRSR
jgi:LysR family glycine cleavage system transcriptional activator